MFLVAAAIEAQGSSAAFAYEDAYDNVADGDWFRTSTNETATLAWGESYVMMSLVAMFRTTGDPLYLDRLALHADAVLANRDDARGVADYRGVSGACWQNTHYQPNGEPYCYAVHSGMIATPIALFAALVAEHHLEREVAYDGATFGAKAASYTAAAVETVAFHEREWTGRTYRFPDDATFLATAGDIVPLNQANALGRLLLVLSDLTDDPLFLDHATALAEEFQADIAVSADGSYLWNYAGGSYVAPGEDISHAAINVDFAVEAERRGVVFDAADLEGFASTFVVRVHQSDHTLADRVGGGVGGTASYEPQGALWAPLTARRAEVYTALRDLYDSDYPASGTTSASQLLGWALLAEVELPLCDWFFYSVDWSEPDPAGWRTATAANANVLVAADLEEACALRLSVDAPVGAEIQQYDGDVYHRVGVWEATGGAVDRLVPYEPRWPFPYWNEGVLYQFVYPFAADDAIRLADPVPLVGPAIGSSPVLEATVGTTYTYTPTGAGDGPYWWLMPTFPTGARIEATSGTVTFTPTAAGEVPFVVRLWTDVGTVDQAFTVTVSDPAVSTTTGTSTTPEPSTPTPPEAVDPAEGPATGGCGCDQTGVGGLGWLAAALLWRRRRSVRYEAAR